MTERGWLTERFEENRPRLRAVAYRVLGSLSEAEDGLRFVQSASINGSAGVVLAPRGTLSKVLIFTIADAKVTRIDVIGDPARLPELDIALL